MDVNKAFSEEVYTERMFQAITTVVHRRVFVGATSTQVIAADGNRDYILIVNNSDETIYIVLGETAKMNYGIRINANGGSLELSRRNTNMFLGNINAICDSGNKDLLITEGFKLE